MNADAYCDTGNSIVSTNQFVYCENNPVYYVDSTGEVSVAGFKNPFLCPIKWFTTPWTTKRFAWQRIGGYCDFYDDIAENVGPSISLKIDRMKCYFDYGLYEWRVEFWKGHYVATTGAEIGFYQRSRLFKHFTSFYRCSYSWFNMKFDLYSFDKNASGNETNCHLIFSADSGELGHWWLTSFLIDKCGNFFPWAPEDLVMVAGIHFKNEKMAEAFLGALEGEMNSANIDRNVVEYLGKHARSDEYVYLEWGNDPEGNYIIDPEERTVIPISCE